MFGAAQLPVNHNTEDIIITVAPFFLNKLAVLMDKESESFTNGIMVQIDLQRATVAFPQLVVSNVFE